MKPRSTRHVPPSPQRAVTGAARPVRARPVRFRLSVHSPRDQAIAHWLEGIPIYYRAEAIRCALYDHLQGRTASARADTSAQRVPSSLPPDSSPSAARKHATATKLRRMF